MKAAKRLSKAMNTGSAQPEHLRKITTKVTPEPVMKKYFTKKEKHAKSSNNEFGY